MIELKKILVIGENCIDRYDYGTCSRLNPEAPTPIFVPHRSVTSPGMAANVCQNLESLNIPVGFITQDEEIIKHRYVEEVSNYILLRVDKEPPIKTITFFPRVMHQIREADAVVVSDYDKGFLNEFDLELIAQNSKLSFLDTKKSLGTWAVGFDWIKINERESKNPEHSKDFLLWNSHKLIITLGGKGARVKDHLYPAKPVEVRDVVGAGDSFLAGFVAAFMQTGDLEKSIGFANLAGSHVVKKRGTADLAEIKESLDFL